MRRISTLIILAAALLVIPLGDSVSPRPADPGPPSDALAGLIGPTAWNQAVAGYGRITEKRKNILVIADFTKPSTAKRLYVVDMNNLTLLYDTWVAHGRGSGENFATSFSNVSGSHKSSLGFYLTGNTYQGGNGYSLLLDGLEKGINDKARERAIVIHGARYCDPSVIASAGRLGRSFGCPALPPDVTREIIDTIKDGAVLYIFADRDDYLAQSAILSPRYPHADFETRTESGV